MEAARAELEARRAARELAAHIMSLPENVRHHYQSPAPLPPEAEEAPKQAKDGDCEGNVCPPVSSQSKVVSFLCTLFRWLKLPPPQLCLCCTAAWACTVAADDFVQPVGAFVPTKGFPVFTHILNFAGEVLNCNAQPEAQSVTTAMSA